jgi:ABC-type dipeptide/oligopeptide/nickel transport system permease subunit
VAGYAGGRVDNLMMRGVDILYSLPSIIFVIVLITTLEVLLKAGLELIGLPEWAKSARLLFLFVGLGAVSWLTMARIVRGQVLSLRTRQFVEASRVLGAGPGWILRRHIIPNVLGVVIVYLTLTVPAIILYESFLSYLGLGIQPPMASWGLLIAEGAEQINPIRIYWWLIVFPGAALVSTLLALNFLGDGLREAWDVRGNN